MKTVTVNRNILAEAWKKEVAGYRIANVLVDPSGTEFDSEFNDFCKSLGLPEEKLVEDITDSDRLDHLIDKGFLIITPTNHLGKDGRLKCADITREGIDEAIKDKRKNG